MEMEEQEKVQNAGSRFLPYAFHSSAAMPKEEEEEEEEEERRKKKKKTPKKKKRNHASLNQCFWGCGFPYRVW
jgi:hypothetical protein